MTCLNFNEVRLMGSIEKMGILKKQPTYSVLEIILNIRNLVKSSEGRWENTDKKVAVTFFGKPAEDVAMLQENTSIFISGEAVTRFNKGRNGEEYANTSIVGKKFQVIVGQKAEESPQVISAAKLAEFDDDIPF